MLKEKFLPMLGKFVHMAFTYDVKTRKRGTVTVGIEAHGHITRVEDRNLHFKDDDNFEYIVELKRVSLCENAGRRRTVKEYALQLIKENEKLQKKLKNARL